MGEHVTCVTYGMRPTDKETMIAGQTLMIVDMNSSTPYWLLTSAFAIATPAHPQAQVGRQALAAAEAQVDTMVQLLRAGQRTKACIQLQAGMTRCSGDVA